MRYHFNCVFDIVLRTSRTSPVWYHQKKIRVNHGFDDEKRSTLNGFMGMDVAIFGHEIRYIMQRKEKTEVELTAKELDITIHVYHPSLVHSSR